VEERRGGRGEARRIEREGKGTGGEGRGGKGTEGTGRPGKGKEKGKARRQRKREG